MDIRQQLNIPLTSLAFVGKLTAGTVPQIGLGTALPQGKASLTVVKLLAIPFKQKQHVPLTSLRLAIRMHASWNCQEQRARHMA